jgi:hypothetical protein
LPILLRLFPWARCALRPALLVKDTALTR